MFEKTGGTVKVVTLLVDGRPVPFSHFARMLVTLAHEGGEVEHVNIEFDGDAVRTRYTTESMDGEEIHEKETYEEIAERMSFKEG